jgi:hypothetical protein
MDAKTFKKYYQDNSYFKLTNPNPEWENTKSLKWNRPDCVIRAVALATGLSWVEAYDFLSAKARRDFTVPNDGTRLRDWLAEACATWNAVEVKPGKKRLDAEGFAKSHPEGRYILRLAHHEAACVDGVILDAWNCSAKCVYGYIDVTNIQKDKLLCH